MASGSNALGSPTARQEETQIRLSYRLSVLGRGAGFLVQPVTASGELMAEHAVKDLVARLHPLDQAVVRELRASTSFGVLTDLSLAKVLPLLAQRATQVDGEPLLIGKAELRPRVQVAVTASGRLEVTLGLANAEEAWIDLRDGRLLASSQAFFLRGAKAWPIASAAPWELGRFAREPTMTLDLAMGAAARDALVRDLVKAGVEARDLEGLAVRRAPPDRVTARFVEVSLDPAPVVKLVVELEYAGEVVFLEGTRPASSYLVAKREHGGLIERDLVLEEDARRTLREAGLRWDRVQARFIAEGEAALSALDASAAVLPIGWQIDREGKAPVFHRDLAVRTQVRLLEERGMLDLEVGFDALGGEPDDVKTVAALLEMRELLDWLASGSQYVRLADGSFVAPSARFRRSLRLLEDLGATAKRALVSPLCIGLLKAIGDEAGVAAADEATERWLEELTQGSAPKEVAPPTSLVGTLRDYQLRGLDWLAMIHRHRLTGILADDMGLGKTVQALALLLKVAETEGRKPSLVVAPTSVVSVWRDEAARFAPSLGLQLWHGPPKLRQAVDVANTDVIVTSYGVLRRDAEILAGINFRYVILDEAQSAKNAASQNARAIRRLSSERRLALTGTPIENRPDDLWSIFDFLAPGFLGTLRHFRKRYARPISRNDVEVTDVLRARIQPLVLRRLKGEVAKELPAKVESLVRCDMGAAQRALYDHVAGKLRESVQRKIEEVGIERAHLDILAALTRLRQICCDPALIAQATGSRAPPSAKLELFEELMREALDSERRIVVFSQFVEMQKRLIDVIRRFGVEPAWLHGGTRHRDKVVASFQDPKGPPVIVVSLRAGGTGVTLTRADTVMHYDPWWNPAVEQQATDRAHRLGQTQQVSVYKLVCARSVEERVVELAKSKESVARDLLGSEGGASAKRISTSDVLALLG